MSSIYATGPQTFAKAAYHCLSQNYITHFLTSSIFIAAALYTPPDSCMDKIREKLIAACRVINCKIAENVPGHTEKAVAEKKRATSEFYFALSGNLLRKTMTVAAFLLVPSPGIRALPSSRVLALTTALIADVQTLRQLQDISSQILKKKEPPPQMARYKLALIGQMLSGLAFFNLSKVAFQNIGSWEQTAIAVATLATSTIIGAYGAWAITKKALTTENARTRDYLVLAGLSAGCIAVLGTAVKSLSWLPQAEIRVVTAIGGLLSCISVFDELKIF